MAMCPLCSRTGLILISIGFIIMFLSVFEILPGTFPLIIGLGFIISAYIVPNLIKTGSCRDGTCETKPNKK